jgi:hypothetical protein
LIEGYMATSITQSLFGITPESLMQERNTAANRQAMDFARLDPFEAARYGLFRGASQLGDAAAGAMGYEDPEIARAKARQGMLSGVDLNNPESLLAKAQSLQATDPMAAQSLVAQANERQSTITAQQEADAKRAAEQRRLTSLAQVVQQKTGLGPEESLALAQDPAAVRELMKDDTAITETKEGVFLVSKKTGNRIARIGDAQDRSTRVNVSPTIKMGGDAVGLMQGIANLTKPEQEMLKSAQTSKSLINEAAASNNSQTWEAARTQIAKAVGEGKLSNEDIRRTGIDPRLVQGALDWVNKKTVGVPNQDIMKQLYVVADLLEKQATNRINTTMAQARTLATDQSGVSPAAAETIFPMVGGGSRGSGGTVNWSDMK